MPHGETGNSEFFVENFDALLISKESQVNKSTVTNSQSQSLDSMQSRTVTLDGDSMSMYIKDGEKQLSENSRFEQNFGDQLLRSS